MQLLSLMSVLLCTFLWGRLIVVLLCIRLLHFRRGTWVLFEHFNGLLSSNLNILSSLNIILVLFTNQFSDSSIASRPFLLPSFKAEALLYSLFVSALKLLPFLKQAVLFLGSFDGLFWSTGLQALPYHTPDYSSMASLSSMSSFLLKFDVFSDTLANIYPYLPLVVELSLMHPADPVRVIKRAGSLMAMRLGLLTSEIWWKLPDLECKVMMRGTD